MFTKLFFSPVKQFTSLTLAEVMSEQVVTLKKTDSVINAATKMIAQGISCVVVVHQGDVQGVVTERDFVNKVPLSTAALNKRVSDIMSTKVTTASPDMTVLEALELFKKHSFRKLVIIEHDKLCGIITQKDLVKLFFETIKHPNSSKPLVSDWMTKKIVSVGLNTSFAQAKKVMKEKDVGAVVVKEKGNERGIFTEHDIVAQLYDQGGILKIGSPKEIMPPYIRCVHANTSVFFANYLMLFKGVRRLLVVEEDKVVGILTQTDVARAVLHATNELLTKKVKHGKKVKKVTDESFITDYLKVYS